MKRLIVLTVAALMVLALLPTAVLATSSNAIVTEGESFDISTMSDGEILEVHKSAAEGDTATITGSKNIQIHCNSGVSVTLNGVTIDNTSANGPAIRFSGNDLDSAQDNTLTLVGTNTLTAGLGWTAVRVAPNAKLTIGGEGTLNATGGQGCAGICGGEGQYGGTIVITGGTIVAQGGANAAGIGGGSVHVPASTMENGVTLNDITISGGKVTATGGFFAAGIGGGYGGTGGTITISGGTVTAQGGNAAAGIGGGYRGSNFSTTISGGTVTATGGDNGGAGIGSGARGDVGTINISGGSVTATGGDFFSEETTLGAGAGIGDGGRYSITPDGELNEAYSTPEIAQAISISGGDVTATGGDGGYGMPPNAANGDEAEFQTMSAGGGAGIGGGGGVFSTSGSHMPDVTISGGNVYAQMGALGVHDIGSGGDAPSNPASVEQSGLETLPGAIISGASAVFLHNDLTITPVQTTTHTHEPGGLLTGDLLQVKETYGMDVPDSWEAAAGGYFVKAIHTVTYNEGANGSIPAGSETEQVVHGMTPANVPEVTPDTDYTFEGWENGGTTYTKAQVEAMAITADTKFTAQYEEPLPADTQYGTITTTVYGPDGITPLPNVPVQLWSDPISGVTDANGRVTFSNVPLVDHTLVVLDDDGAEIGRIELNIEAGTANETAYQGSEIDVTFNENAVSVNVSLILANDEITIDDVTITENPETGGGRSLWWLLGAAAIAAVAAVFFERRRVRA